MLLLRLSGVFWLRCAARKFLALLFQEPPRSTRVALKLPCGAAQSRTRGGILRRVVGHMTGLRT
jgi:hypothetical protein